MEKAAIAIGINRVGNLPTLAARSSANQFAAWAKTQGFKSKALTDEKGPVTLKKIKNAIKSAVDNGCQQLIVYFSGHGIFCGPNYELWLLSGAPDDPDEAVNLPLSIEMSRNLPLKHVVFVSDACRSVAGPESPALSQMNGGVIFPNSQTGAVRPDVDIFYAALPGRPALEVQVKDAVKNFKAIFTSCLMEGLSGKDHSVIEVMSGRTVVPAWTLKRYLIQAVPKAAAAVHVKLRQVPEVRVESHAPLYLAEVNAPNTTGVRRRPEPRADRVRTLTRRSEDTELQGLAAAYDLSKYFAPADGLRKLRQHKDRGIDEGMKRILDSQARVSFETKTGFTVVGQKVRSVTFPAAPCDLFEANLRSDGPRRGARRQPLDQHIRIHASANGLASFSVLIEFENGLGTCLAVLPGFIGAVLVDEGVVVNVNYTPSRGTPRYKEYLAFQEDVDKRRAFAAAASESGYFRVERASSGRFSAYVRQMKQVDPTLGLYAAYAYFQGGLREETLSVYSYMANDFRRDRTPVLFDVALLASQVGGTTAKAPFCPMLTQGWALLGDNAKFLPPKLRQAGRHLAPALWTTFSKEGVTLAREALLEGAQ